MIEKAGTIERQVYHPLLRPLRRHIMSKSGIRITYEVKNGRVNEGHTGLPYKLEYSMVKREWYLLWYHTRRRAFMSTRLNKIHAVEPEPLNPRAAESMLKRIGNVLESRQKEVVIEIVRAYNEELSRILYASPASKKRWSMRQTPTPTG